MEEIEWKTLAELDLDARLSVEGYELGDQEEREKLRIGIRCKNPDMLEAFLDTIKRKMRWKGIEVVHIDCRKCTGTRDYQRVMIDGILAYIKDKYPEWRDKIRGRDLSTAARSCFAFLEMKSKELRGKLIMFIDFRDIKIKPEILEPGEKFWWIFECANRLRASNLIWTMDEDPKGFEILTQHGEMEKVFSPEGTDLFLL